MPHLILEHSDNLPAPLDHGALFRALHDVLDRSGLFQPEDVKSRAIAYPHFRVGAGDPQDVFVHLTVAIMAGRDAATRKRLGAELLEVLKGGLGPAWTERRCDVTVEVREMDRESYAKAVSRR